MSDRHTYFCATNMIRICTMAKWIYKLELENQRLFISPWFKKIYVTEFCKTIQFKMDILRYRSGVGAEVVATRQIFPVIFSQILHYPTSLNLKNDWLYDSLIKRTPLLLKALTGKTSSKTVYLGNIWIPIF